MPHMHWRGKAYRYEAIYPDGREEVLLSVPRYDFNWQTYYWYEEPVSVPKGTQIRSVAHWDNSRNNLYNPDPSAEVRFGLQTADEMMLGWMNYVWERPGAGSEVLALSPGDPAGVFDQADRNGDGQLTEDELDDGFRRAMQHAKIDTSQPVSREAFAKFLEAMRHMRAQRLEAIREGKIPADGGRQRGQQESASDAGEAAAEPE